MQPTTTATMIATSATAQATDVEFREPLAPLTFTIDLDAHIALRQMARARGTTRSALVREIVLAALASASSTPPAPDASSATGARRPRRARRPSASAVSASAVA